MALHLLGLVLPLRAQRGCICRGTPGRACQEVDADKIGTGVADGSRQVALAIAEGLTRKIEEGGELIVRGKNGTHETVIIPGLRSRSS